MARRRATRAALLDGEQKDTRDPDKPHPFVQKAKLASVGLEMGLAVAIGLGIGYWLDKYFATEPILLIVFLLFGIAAGFRGMVRAAKEAAKDHKKSDDDGQS